MPARAKRRHHQRRMKAKALKLYPHDAKATNANHLTECSCHMCGNPRKWWNEKTMQERKFNSSTRLYGI